MIVVIPAKGTSSRVPGKNLRPLAGQPLVLWTIEAALDAAVGPVLVSTDHPTIAKLAETAGARVIERPEALARDPAEAPDVALHALDCAEQQGFEFGSVMMLLPTSPFRNATHIREAVALHRTHALNVLSVTEAPELTRKLHVRLPDSPTMVPRAIAAPLLLNGAIWIATRQRLRADGFFSGHAALPYVMDRYEGIDIDTEADFALAEMIARWITSSTLTARSA